MKTVYLLKYNNYNNRILKRGESVLDYIGASNENVITYIDDMTLWNPNDGVNTSIKTNLNTVFSVEPDYCITVDNYGNIVSRWFVMENTRIRKGQYECKLKRDVIAESWEALQDATCWIDRALLKATDSRIFSAENISLSQIKTSETLLKDKTGVPWIICYGQPGLTTAPTGSVEDNNLYDIYTDLTKEQYIEANSFKYLWLDQDNINISLLWTYSQDGVYGSGQHGLNFMQNETDPYLTGGSSLDRYMRTTGLNIEATITDTSAVPVNDLFNSFKSEHPEYKSRQMAEVLEAKNNKILYSQADGKYYRINVFADSGFNPDQYNIDNTSALGPILLNQVRTNVSNLRTPGDVTYDNLSMSVDFYTMEMTLIELPDYATTYTFPIDKYRPNDAPYFAWCMPYGDIKTRFSSVDAIVETNKEMNLSIANSLARNNSTSNIYSIEILPYCPLPEKYFDTDGQGNFVLNAMGDEDLTDNTTIVEGANVKGFIYCMPRTSFKADIECNVYTSNKKVESITDLWRLTSPGNSSSFEFSVAKNNGVKGFTASCTYIPVNPYIAIRPIWSNINGGNFPDSRCLVIHDDFSITRMSDAWIGYQEQNKNFEAIFNRQIENMDVSRKYQRVSEAANAITGAVGAGILGGTIFGPAGAGIAAGLSAGAGVTDLIMSENMYQENKAYTKDIHELQLGNIQAMPTTIAKTTGINIDNRYFPVLEKFTCSSSEKYAVNKYLVNNSFNCGFIDTLGLYVNNTWTDQFGNQARGFISGRIIKIDIPEDAHYYFELNRELSQGVYMR